MQCLNCGTTIPDDSVFCTNCGTVTAKPENDETPSPSPVVATAATRERVATPPAGKSTNAQNAPAVQLAADGVNSQPGQPVQSGVTTTEIPRPHRGACVTGIVCGVFCIVAGLLVVLMASPGCEATSFGGDAYTYIYQGIVAVANTVTLLTKALGGCLAAIGVFMACYFANKLHSAR